MQSYMSRNFTHIASIIDGVSRVIQAANGGHPAGVSYTNTATGVQGTVTVDLKGDGSEIATVNATITYNNPAQGISGGATMSVSSINSASTTGSATAGVAVGGGGTTVQFSSGTADLHPTDGPDLSISGANLTVSPTLSTPTIIGSAAFAADNKTGNVFFESNQSGGYKIRVTSSAFTTFTVP